MKLEQVHIKNYKSMKDLHLKSGNLISIIGENNSGKSNVLEALDLFFNPSKDKLSEWSFYSKETSQPIEIIAEFKEMNTWEKNYFSKWICADKLKIKRVFNWREGDSPELIPIWIRQVPSPEWLRDDDVSTAKITEWWKVKDKLTIGNNQFHQYLGTTRPSVEEWKRAITTFLKEHGTEVPPVEVEKENPTGLANVLKGGLPEFILVPAVRDITDEVKVAKTNPFGRLIYALMRKIPPEQKSKIKIAINKINELINKVQGQERIHEIREIEELLKKMMCPFMECDLEIEVPFPDLEDMFGKVNLYVNDGIRTSVDTKGHGLQRSVIFSILRAYAELIRKGDSADKEKTVIFAIEEPELYLHPQAQRAMMQALRDISEGKDQVIYCTHSSAFVNIAYFDEICLMRREQINGQWSSVVTQLSMDTLLNDLKARHPAANPTPESIRERYSHVYSGTRAEGLFAKKVILVEGLTEEYSIPLYSEALGYNMDKEGISVVSSGGKGQIDRLLRVFNELKIPCFVVFDGDKSSNNGEVKKMTKEILDFFEWKGTCPPQTCIEERFAVFEEKYETQMDIETPDYNVIATAAKKELGLHDDSGKPLVARYMARNLIAKGKSEGDPAKYVPPTIRVIIDKVKNLKWQKTILRQ